MSILFDFLAENESDISFAIDESFCFLKNEREEQLVIRLLDEIYPEYKVVLPESFDRFFFVNKNYFYKSLWKLGKLLFI